MGQPLLIAAIRAVTGGVVVAGSAFFATLAGGAGLQAAEIAAGAAFFATLATRGAAEGLYDGVAARQPAAPAPAHPLGM